MKLKKWSWLVAWKRHEISNKLNNSNTLNQKFLDMINNIENLHKDLKKNCIK
jgi:hypothetical protein